MKTINQTSSEKIRNDADEWLIQKRYDAPTEIRILIEERI